MNTRPQEFSGLSIKRVSTAAQVAVAIRNKILNGELIPGMQLQEIPIAAAAEVSRHTIREAIQILVREGLVRHNVHRGFTVTQLCDADIDDIYRVRFERMGPNKTGRRTCAGPGRHLLSRGRRRPRRDLGQPRTLRARGPRRWQVPRCP